MCNRNVTTLSVAEIHALFPPGYRITNRWGVPTDLYVTVWDDERQIRVLPELAPIYRALDYANERSISQIWWKDIDKCGNASAMTMAFADAYGQRDYYWSRQSMSCIGQAVLRALCVLNAEHRQLNTCRCYRLKPINQDQCDVCELRGILYRIEMTCKCGGIMNEMEADCLGNCSACEESSASELTPVACLPEPTL